MRGWTLFAVLAGVLVTLGVADQGEMPASTEASRDSASASPDVLWASYRGAEGPGKGKHVVLISGDEEYRSEEALPQLAKILSRHHGFDCTVLFALDPKTGQINPDIRNNIPGLYHLEGADLMIIATRFRDLDDRSMRYIDAYLKAGKPVIGMRTATHAFNIAKDKPWAHYGNGYRGEKKEWHGGFGRLVLGEKWISHHGHHKREGTRGVLAPETKTHPILRGLKDGDVWGPTDVYGVRLPLPGDSKPLILGQVQEDVAFDKKDRWFGMRPSDPPLPADHKKNSPMMPVAWIKSYQLPEGNKGTAFTTTMGAATDLEAEGTRRLLVNATYHLLGLPVPARADVDPIQRYRPTAYGFGGYVKGRRPDEHELQPPFTLRRRDRVVCIGNALAERMQHNGFLEFELQRRAPDLQLTFRNLGFSGDEVTERQRTAGFGTPEEWLDRSRADIILAFFGHVESFGSKLGVDAFRKDLLEFARPGKGRGDGGEKLRHVALCSPIPVEPRSYKSGDARARNAMLREYAWAMKEVALTYGLKYVDLFSPMLESYAASREPLTINGVHLNERGNRVLAGHIGQSLLPRAKPLPLDGGKQELLLQAIREKNRLWFNRYRATDGYNVYGGRSSLSYDGYSNYDVLQRELQIIDVMCSNRDRRIHALARGRDVQVRDDNLPREIFVPTNYPGPLEGGAHEFLDGEKAIGLMTVHSGMEISLFADEKRFPEIGNPVQMAFGPDGRLWVLTWPTYPHWKPGEPMNDKVVVLEDTDGDGKADKSTVFADDLHNPTGIEFWNGGVFVACAPDLLFLRDENGDGRADRKERVLHGLSSADTHHAANSFEIGPDGALYFQEGTFHMSQIETVDGVMRNRNGCVWRFEPRTWKVERHVPYNFANPHGHVFDRWGQNFVTDGTGNQNYFALAFSGHVNHPDKKRGYFTYFKQRSRPCAGTEILSSTHFPESLDGNLLIANVIGFRGIFNYEFVEQGSGFTAKEVEPVVHSRDPRFRPADIEVGPDGAIWFLDWYNPIIGHMQHHLRDPNRDKKHGRVYRVVAKGRKTNAPLPVAGQPIPALLDLLKHREYRVRNRARLELSGRESAKVLKAAKDWAAALDREHADFEHHRLEALWLHQQHDAVDRELLNAVLASKEPRARAAAVRVARGMRHRLPDALKIMRRAAADDHPRVRLEALVGASFFTGDEAVAVALEVRRHPMDKFLNYALAETMRTLEPVWRGAIRRGELTVKDDASIEYLLSLVGPEEVMKLPRTPAVLRAILTRGGMTREQRRDASIELAGKGDAGPADVTLASLREVDRAEGGHVRTVVRELSGLLQEQMAKGKAPSREALLALARTARHREAREAGYAAVISADGGLDAAWSAAAESRPGMAALLGALPMVEDAALRNAAFTRVRPLLFDLPAALRAPEGAGPASGLAVSFYRGTPKNARLATFRKLEAEVSGTTPQFGLKSDVIRQRDQFGLLFEGTITVPAEGEYVFFTNSDDGSRLYIDGEEVVANDGPHGMVEKSGKVRLGAGPHAIVVTYYDQGGGDGLIVSWRGPGFTKQPIPPEVLSRSGVDPVRAAAIRALASMPGREKEKFEAAIRLFDDEALAVPAVALIESTTPESWPEPLIAPAIDGIAGFVATVPATGRTAPHVVNALAQARRLAASLPEAEAAPRRLKLQGLAGTRVRLATLPHRMRYDRRGFAVSAGKPVAITFVNDDVMPHNLVITKPGALETIGEIAEAMPQDAREYVPERPEVLWHTRLLNPGEAATLKFVAPETPGRYPFVCTFPGHWRVMNGIMEVVDGPVDDPEPVSGKNSAASAAPARKFVKYWTMEDLAPAFVSGWDRMRRLDRGQRMFTAAGCIKCHGFRGEGVKSAPDLTRISDKYRGAELLRHIVEPSLAILEGYEPWLIESKEGDVWDGVIVSEDAEKLHLRPDLQDHANDVIIPKSEIADRTQLKCSSMPTGLLVTLSKAEILDLVAWLEAGNEKR